MAEDEIKAQAVSVLSGQPTFLNSPADARSIYVDGVSGLGTSNNCIKVNFWEQVADPNRADEILARFILTLILPNEQFFKIAKVFAKITEELSVEAPEPGEQEPK